jgi:CRP/FNR family transcriptional regulator, cyclic AMP receptor protein
MSATSQMLAHVDLFAELPEAVREELATRGSTRSIPAGQPVVTQGQEDAGLQMLTEGSADVIVHGNPVRTLAVGDYFGEISLIDSQPRSATIVAGPNGCRTFTVSPLLFGQILEEHHGVSRLVMKGLTARLRAAEAALQALREQS